MTGAVESSPSQPRVVTSSRDQQSYHGQPGRRARATAGPVKRNSSQATVIKRPLTGGQGHGTRGAESKRDDEGCGTHDAEARRGTVGRGPAGTGSSESNGPSPVDVRDGSVLVVSSPLRYRHAGARPRPVHAFVGQGALPCRGAVALAAEALARVPGEELLWHPVATRTARGRKNRVVQTSCTLSLGAPAWIDLCATTDN